MLLRNRGRSRVLARLSAAVLPALVATGVLAGQAQADLRVIDRREAVGSATGTEGLEPALALAYTLAEHEAHAQGVPLSITSGYRTPAEQQALWADGVATYGPDGARRWVLPPDESTHVSGRAIDVGPRQGAQWLETNGNRWGLCRMFENEWWHFELATAPGADCPPMMPDASVR
ncbi:D-alanyl-D-alanine carboxypeptidase family protein [Nocardia sp. R6R-6]|uniref:D-alanyl-D-alanine carboxypeptidase family protein n=1 Tax=Nocardia sp. R6R-6 TaxID=3459303 RepID=UPI00403D9C0A